MSASIPSMTHDTSDWAPTPHELDFIFKTHKDYTLAERTLGTKSWVWKYGVDIQCSTKRRWVCLPCIRHKRHPAMSYSSKGTQNIHTHLWSAHRLRDPSGRNPKKTLASITDLLAMDRSDPQQQTLANKLISRNYWVGSDPEIMEKSRTCWRTGWWWQLGGRCTSDG